MDFHSHGEVVPAYNPYFPPPTSMMSLLSGTQEQNQTEEGHQPPPTIMIHHPPVIPDHHHHQHHHHHQNQFMQAECKGFSSIPLNPFGEWGYNDSKPEISAKFSNVFLASTGNPLTPLEVDNAIIGTLHDNKDYNMSRNGNESSDANIIGSEEEYLIRKRRAKIRSHPLYQQLVALYINCQKVGASPDLVASLDKVGKEYESMDAINRSGDGPDPELDQFMEEYCCLLQSLQEELTAPFKEAMGFFRKMEQQLNTLSKGSIKLSHSGDEEMELLDASSEDEGGSYGELDAHDMNPLAEDTKIKEQLLRKYGSYIGTLKKEFLKKRKKGKLPKDARLQLLDWWTKHYRWPYPSEGEKTSLAQSTGLDQKQINNWFINQRKRHWKPSEDNIDHYGMADGTSNSGSLENALLPMG